MTAEEELRSIYVTLKMLGSMGDSAARATWNIV